jgi:hypothetical protein
MLGETKLENYHPDFITRLIDYSENLNYNQLVENDAHFVIDLARKWPRFSKNNDLMNALLKVKGENIVLKDQKSCIRYTVRKTDLCTNNDEIVLQEPIFG